MPRSREAIKAMIALAQTEQEADTILSEEFPSTKEKYAYLKGMFDFTIIGCHDGNNDKVETDYKAVLSTIVNQKWRV
jgi:hypothetical protein